MANYQIKSPDGATYQITAPDNASQSDILSYAQQNHVQQSNPNPGQDLGAGYAALSGFNSAVPFGNRITAGLGSAFAAPFSDQSMGNLYDQMRANQANTNQAHPGANLAGSLGGIAATLPLGIETVGSKALAAEGGIRGAINGIPTAMAQVGNFVRGGEVAPDATVLAKAGNLGLQSLKSAAVAAPVGAIYGYGDAPEGQRLQGAASNAGMAAALGAAMPVASAGFSALNNALGKTVVPNANALRSKASQLYQQATDNGGILTPDFSDKFVDDITKLKPQTELGKIVTGDTPFTQMVDKLQVLKGKPITLDTAQEIDEAIGNAIDSNMDAGRLTKDGKKLLDIQTAFRNNIDAAKPDDIIGGKEGFDALNQARQYWSAGRRMDDVERIINRAQYSENPATAIKSGFRTLLSNTSRMRGFSPDDVKAIQNAATSGLVSETLKTLGSGLVRVMAPFSGAGLAGDAAITGASLASKNLSSKLAMNKASQVMQSIANGVSPPVTTPLIDFNSLAQLMGNK